VLVCVLGRPAPAPATGWQTRRDTIFVPHSEYDERGQMVRYTLQNNASSYIQQLYEYQYRQALQRQEDAKGAVSEAVNTSGWALAGAAVACGATALVPTP
jgi:hypothetical protein